jgi:hypothetical protein
MAQIFHPSMKVISRASVVAGLIIIVGGLVIGGALYRSSYMTDVYVAREQVVPFSHEHHVNGLGISCGYCHTSVENSAFAGIPPTHTCMTCHSQIWNTSPMLEPVRTSYATDRPLEWVRVHDLPDYVYFDHSIHVGKGMGCTACHGQVNMMPLTWKSHSLQMQWCIECHRAPELQIRPKDRIYDMTWVPPANQAEMGLKLVKEYKVKTGRLTDCSICHR